MRRIAAVLLLFTVSTTWVNDARATTDRDSVGFVYYSLGLNLMAFGSLRFGHNDWEFGYLGNGSIGIDKIFQAANSNFYVSFGPAATGNLEFGFYGGAGFNWRIFNWLAFRSELAALGSVAHNKSSGFLLAGLAAHL